MFSQKIYSLILAGKRKADPLSQHFGIENKAFIRIQEKYLIERVLIALKNSQINNIIISLQSEQESLFSEKLKNFIYTTLSLPDTSSPVAAVFKALKLCPKDNGLLVTTADNALLSPEIIECFLQICKQSSAQIIIATVNGKEGLIDKYPQAKRTWHKLNSQTWLSGANLFYLNTQSMNDKSQDILFQLETKRKSPLKFAQIIAQNFDWKFFLKLLFQKTSIKECNLAFSCALGLKVELITLPFFEACIDIDNLKDIELAENILNSALSKVV